MNGRLTRVLGSLKRLQEERSPERDPSSVEVSWFCNFALGIPHHNIMDKKKNYISQRTSQSEKEDPSRKIRHLVACGFSSLSLAARRGVGVLSKPGTFIK